MAVRQQGAMEIRVLESKETVGPVLLPTPSSSMAAARMLCSTDASVGKITSRQRRREQLECLRNDIN